MGQQLRRLDLHRDEHHHQRSGCLHHVPFNSRGLQRPDHDDRHANQLRWGCFYVGNPPFTANRSQLRQQQRKHLGHTNRIVGECHLHCVCQQQRRLTQHHVHTRTQLDADTKRRGCLHHPQQFHCQRHHVGMGLRSARSSEPFAGDWRMEHLCP